MCGGETVHFWGFRGELGGWDVSGGRFGVPVNGSRHFATADRGSGWGKAWGSAVIDGDVAVALGGSMFGTGSIGTGWGELRGRGGVLARRWGPFDWQSCSVECTARSDEHARTSSHNDVPWAVDGFCVSSMAWGWISDVTTIVWVLDETQVVVFELGAAGASTVVDGGITA